MTSFKFELIQYKIFRKLFGGSYYLNYNWITPIFWSDTLITSCGGRAIKEEHYVKQTKRASK